MVKLKVRVPTVRFEKQLVFEKNEKVSNVISKIRSSVPVNTRGFSLRKGENGPWMDANETIDRYDVKNGDILNFMKKSCKFVSIMYEGLTKQVNIISPCMITASDNFAKVIIDYALPAEKIMPLVAAEFGVTMPELWGLQYPDPETKDVEWLNKGETFIFKNITYEVSMQLRKKLNSCTTESLEAKKIHSGRVVFREALEDAWVERNCILSNQSLYLFKVDDNSQPIAVIPTVNMSFKVADGKVKGKEKKKRIAIELQYAVPQTSFVPEQHRNSLLFAVADEQARKVWLAAFKDSKEVESPKYFGIPLADVLANEDHASAIPLLVSNAIEYIKGQGLQTEGILRLSGNQTDILRYKSLYDEGKKPTFDGTKDPHVVSGTLKMFLRELPEPPFLFRNYELAMKVIQIEDPKERIQKLKELIHSLPKANAAFLKALSDLCRDVAQYEAKNKMGLPNVATLMGPNLLKQKEEGIMEMALHTPFLYHIAKAMIGEFDFIFGDKEGPSDEYLKEKPIQSASGEEESNNTNPDYTKRYARALYEFVPENSEGLAFRDGDVIFVTYSDDTGWWHGELNGIEGEFPGSYVELLSNEEIENLLKEHEESVKRDQQPKTGGKLKKLVDGLMEEVELLKNQLEAEKEARLSLETRLVILEEKMGLSQVG